MGNEWTMYNVILVESGTSSELIHRILLLQQGFSWLLIFIVDQHILSDSSF